MEVLTAKERESLLGEIVEAAPRGAEAMYAVLDSYLATARLLLRDDRRNVVERTLERLRQEGILDDFD